MAFSLMLTLPNGIVHAEDTLDVPQVVTEEQMNYELGPESPYAGQYITYGIDENGNYVNLFEPLASKLEKEGLCYVVSSVGLYSDEFPYTAFYAKKSSMTL